MKQVMVTISGPTASGKTVIANLIAEALTANPDYTIQVATVTETFHENVLAVKWEHRK